MLSQCSKNTHRLSLVKQGKVHLNGFPRVAGCWGIKARISAVQRDVCFNRASGATLIDTVTVGSVCVKQLGGGQMDWGGRVRGAVQNWPL